MKLTQDQRDENAELRIRVYSNLDPYLGQGNMNPVTLCELLGYKNLADMKTNFTFRDIEICRALSGPHGLTIYKMLLIRDKAETSPP